MLESSINCMEESDFKAVTIFHIVIYIRVKQINESEKYVGWRFGSVGWMEADLNVSSIVRKGQHRKL